MEYTLTGLLGAIGVILAVALLAPVLLFDRCVGIEAGQYRVGYCRYGYSFQIDWRHNGYSLGGLWPWDRYLRPGAYADPAISSDKGTRA